MLTTRLSRIISLVVCVLVPICTRALDLPEYEMQYEKKTGKVTGIVNRTASLTSAVKIQKKQYVSPEEKAFQAIQAADKFLLEKGNWFGIKNVASELYPKGVTTDSIGTTQVRYEQRFSGIPVEGSDIITQLNSSNEVLLTKGQFFDNINVDTTSKVSQSRALKIAKKDLESNASWNKILRLVKKENRVFCRKRRNINGAPSKIAACVNKAVRLFNKANGYYEAEPIQLLIKENTLVWKVNLTNFQDRGQTYFIDAKAGIVHSKESHEQHATVRNVFDCGDEYGDISCWLNRITTTFGYVFYYGRGEGQPERGPNPNPAPINGSTDVDYFYDTGIPDINNFYLTKFGRDGLNSLGGTVVPSAAGPNNLSKFFANGDWSSLSEKCAQYGAWAVAGTGSVTACRGSRTFDLIAHESSHIVARNMKLNPDHSQVSLGKQLEVGALNEHISDLLAEGFEKWKTGTNDWIFWPEVLGGRPLNDPPAFFDTVSSSFYPDNYNSPNFYCASSPPESANDFGGIHHNSTVPSKAAYLASVGGSFNGCTILGIGLDKVEQIWYRALTTYFTVNETFNMAYNSLNQACQDLVGNPTPEMVTAGINIIQSDCDQVKAALQSVEMDQAGGCNGGVPANNNVTPTCAIPEFSADFNGDSVVDNADYQILRGRWSYPNEQQALRSAPPEGDANLDGSVDIDDYNILVPQFMADNGGQQPPPAPTMVGDLDLNGVLNINDYVQWKQTNGQVGLALLADTDVNGEVNSDDLQMWASHLPLNPGDVNNDLVVDKWDYNVIRGEWNETGASLSGDINEDGLVGAFDYEVWFYLYNQPDAPLSPTIAGDYNLDGQVDGTDYDAWRNSYGGTGPGILADGNADGVVDAADYTVWRDNLGATVEPPALQFYAGDCDFDGDVDGADFMSWQRSVGTSTELACDFDGDLDVDGADLSLWQENYGNGN